MNFEKSRTIDRANDHEFHMVSSKKSTLENIARVAADRFKENAKLFKQIEDSGGNPMVTPNAAERLSEQFELQAREAMELVELLQRGIGFAILHVEEETDD